MFGMDGTLTRHEASVLPDAVFGAEPSPALVAFLSVVDPRELSGHDQVKVLRAHQRLISHFQAKFYEDLAALADVMFEFDDDWELATEATAMELRAALRLTRRMADIELDLAEALVHRLPRVGRALQTGQIDLRRARVLVAGTEHLDQTQAREVVDQLIDRAGELTTGELRARVRSACTATAPEAANARYRTAHEERSIHVEPTVAGTADIHLTGAAPDKAAAAASARIDQIAKSLHSPGETRTMDQLRADIAIDLLCGTGAYQTTSQSNVTVHVDLDTLARLTEMPGELSGYGPVIADIARQTAEQTRSSFRFRVTDADTGQPVAMGITRKRRHNAHQRRQVELRDIVCAFPGCRMPSTECDIDHVETWADTGVTTIEGSAPACRHDHASPSARLEILRISAQRHAFDWEYTRTAGGDYLWRSRLGHLYTKSGRPPPEPD